VAAGARGIGPGATVVKGAIAWRTLVCRTHVVLKAKTEFNFGLTTLINLHHHLLSLGETDLCKIALANDSSTAKALCQG